MVAISLPFWMHPSRAMVPFPADDMALPGPLARDVAPAAVPARASTGPIVVERCAAAAIEAHADAWAALAPRALEPNVFMEPGFALPAIRHFAPGQRPSFLLCWGRGAAGAPALLGLLALQNRWSPVRAPVAEAWHHPQWVVSAPLLDRDHAEDALAAMLAELGRHRGERGGLVLRGLAVDGPTMRLLAGHGRTIVTLDRRSRAVLRPTPAGPALDPKRAKEMRRQRRRLADGASLSDVRSARTVEEVRVATERFLELEARGWKGARGTALLQAPRLATFTRTMTRLLARQGLCRIDTLEVDGEAAAIGIVLRSGDRAYFWKTAYDETRRRHSPGKLLAAAVGETQRADPAVALTDSCAVPNHPMIDRLWSDRMTIADVLVGVPGAPLKATAVVAGWLRLKKRGRDLAKVGVAAIRARLRGR